MDCLPVEPTGSTEPMPPSEKHRTCPKHAAVAACEYVGYARASRKNGAQKNAAFADHALLFGGGSGERIPAIDSKNVIFIPLDAAAVGRVGLTG